MKRANAILRSASVFRGGTRPPTSMMVEYTDAHREEFGVESICNVLPIAPSTYHDDKTREPCARAVRDAEMKPILADMFKANYSVYGARKLWHAARRAGHDIGRDQVARLMRDLDIRGATRRGVRFEPRSPTMLRRVRLIWSIARSPPRHQTSCG